MKGNSIDQMRQMGKATLEDSASRRASTETVLVRISEADKEKIRRINAEPSVPEVVEKVGWFAGLMAFLKGTIGGGIV